MGRAKILDATDSVPMTSRSNAKRVGNAVLHAGKKPALVRHLVQGHVADAGSSIPNRVSETCGRCIAPHTERAGDREWEKAIARLANGRSVAALRGSLYLPLTGLSYGVTGLDFRLASLSSIAERMNLK